MRKKLLMFWVVLLSVISMVGCSLINPDNSKVQNKLKGDDTPISDAEEIMIFDHYATDDLVKHDIGKLGEGRSWQVGIEDFNSMTQKLSNAGVLAEIDDISLNKGRYMFTAEVAINAELNKMSSVNLEDPVAAVQVLNSNGKVIANQYILGTIKLVSEDYTSYPVAFEIPTKEEFSFRVVNVGRNAVSVQRMFLHSLTKAKEDYRKIPVKNAFAESEEQTTVQYDENKIYYYDLYSTVSKYSANYQNAFDIGILITALQGIVNRDKPRLFVRFDIGSYQTSYPEVDKFWLNYLSETKNFLPKKDDQIEVFGINTLLRIFKDYYSGTVLWDTHVPATLNMACTDAGVNSTLPVRFSHEYDSVYYQLKDYAVKLDLVNKFTGEGKIFQTKENSTGSPKNDVYIWGIEKYLKTGLTNAYVMANYIDGWVGNDGFMPINFVLPTGSRLNDGTEQHGGNPVFTKRVFDSNVVNRDYFISKKAFFVDLLTTDIHKPVDDLNQKTGLDLQTLEKVLLISNARAVDKSIEMGGFTKWAQKYSSHVQMDATHPGAIEGITSKLYTKYNIVWSPDADFSFANASVYSHYPAPSKYINKNTETMKENAANAQLENKNYVIFYMGEYDSAAWLSRSMPTMFTDVRLGDYPLMWPIIPINESRASHVYDFMYSQMTENDVMVGGNNGLGYCYWTNFFADGREGLNGTFDGYVQQTKAMNKKYGLDIMGTYFSGEDFNTMGVNTRAKIYDALADLYPSGVSVLNGSRTIYRHKGVVFSGKDPGKNGRSISYQGGVLTVLTDDAAEYSTSILSNAIDSGKLNRPMFHVVRVVLVTPTDLFTKFEALKSKYPSYNFEITDPYKFFKLYGDYRDNVISGVYPELE